MKCMHGPLNEVLPEVHSMYVEGTFQRFADEGLSSIAA